MPNKHSGRRPGPNATRSQIEETARRHFAERGYDRTSMRQIAIETGVDPALVTHYFGTKLELFFSPVVDLPMESAVLIDYVVTGDPDGAGLRLATAVLAVLDDEVRRRPIVAMLRAATAEPEAARLVREEFLTRNLFLPMAQRLESDNAGYRAALVGSQMIGLALARYIVGIEPRASHPSERVTADVGATFQRYLLGDLTQ